MRPLGRRLRRPLGARHPDPARAARACAPGRAPGRLPGAPGVGGADPDEGRSQGSATDPRAAHLRSGALRQPDGARPARAFEGQRMISTVEKVLFLKSIDLFRALPSEELAQIAEIAEEQPLLAGDRVFAQGEPGDALYLIVEGKVKVHQGDKELVRLGVRDVFGEMAVLDSEPRSASVTAVEDAVLLKIGRDDFRDILGERPEIAMGVMKVLTRRLRETSRKS